MRWLNLLVWFSLLGSCCPKYSNIPQEMFSGKEITFLAKNCEYLELICSERMVKADENNKYKYDKRLIAILKETDCTNGLTSTELISTIGEPSDSTDLLIAYTFLKESDSDEFIMISFGLENGVVIGKAILTGHSVGKPN